VLCLFIFSTRNAAWPESAMMTLRTTSLLPPPPHLNREFASRLFSFVRFTTPGHEIRAALWKAFIPPGALPLPLPQSQSQPQSQPLPAASKTSSATVSIGSMGPASVAGVSGAVVATKGHSAAAKPLNFEQLGRRFELNPGSIRAAVTAAVSEAAMRVGGDNTGTYDCLFVWSKIGIFIQYSGIYDCFLLVFNLVRQSDLMLGGELEVEKVRLI
jgi:hypothetical protein